MRMKLIGLIGLCLGALVVLVLQVASLLIAVSPVAGNGHKPYGVTDSDRVAAVVAGNGHKPYGFVA